MTPEQLRSIADELENKRELLRVVIEIIQSFGPEFMDLIEPVLDEIVDQKARAVKRLEDEHGFARDDAIALTVDTRTSMARYLRKTSEFAAKFADEPLPGKFKRRSSGLRF